MKKFLTKKVIPFLMGLSVAILSVVQTSAAVNVKEGIKKATNEVTSQFKGVVPSIFTVITLVCLVFTIFKVIKAFLSYRRQEEIAAMPIVLGIIGTIISSLACAWSFFSSFGVS